ncbi:MAG: hypothetical protein GY832_26080 [Chloroflexi bacterium]|nr:hypothetical protein [Chloroflexota bacterium]
MGDTIFIRDTKARRAQLDEIGRRIGREGDTDNVDFALCLTLAFLGPVEPGAARVFDLSAGGLAAVPDVEAQMDVLIESAWGAVMSTASLQEAQGQARELLRLAVYERTAHALSRRDGGDPEETAQALMEAHRDGHTSWAEMQCGVMVAMHLARLDAIDRWTKESE